MAALPLVAFAVAVVLPLVREFREFRRDWGFGRLPALLTSLLLFPALGVGTAVALPLPVAPALQWTITVVVTIAVYSAATSALRPGLEAAPRRSS
jgi:hypothetical protein